MQFFRAIIFKVLSVLLFVVMAGIIKSVSGHVPPGQSVFFRSLFAIPVIVVWLAMRKELRIGLKTQNPMNHVWRGVIGTSAMAMTFGALGLLPLPEMTAIGYAMPIFVVVFAAMFLNEPVRLFRLMTVAVGLVGVMIIMAPRLSVDVIDMSETLGAVLALGSAVTAALAQVFIRKLTKTETTSSIVFWFSVTATGLSLLTIYWGWVVPTPKEAALLVLAGIIGGVGQILLTSSYRLADASFVAPFEYASMLFSIAIGFAFFDEVPTSTTLIGASVVIFAGILIIWRERQLGLERTKTRKAMSPQG
ncbi:MAG: DMT family transporter [Marivivens sp.]|uniref:DMT family transporter n=1 Tax=Marivivens sp. TaxID=1978374 RepID=UPI0017F11375|nr:DMT family transporter [Marivivens sp.]NVJ96375.1 DMT family transporter [Marivivens sp.]